MSTNTQRTLGEFLALTKTTVKQIKYNPQFMDHRRRVEKDEINFMNIVTHPSIRIVLKPNEYAVTRALHPNPRFAKATNIILMRGTQYGLLALFGRECEYNQDRTGKFHGPIPNLHATRSFLMAADRFFKRRGIAFSLQGSEATLVEWILSESFTDDMQEQVKADIAAGIKLGDGMAPKPAYKKPAGSIASATAPSNDAKFERRSKPRQEKKVA